jgi:glycosyltransferase involved in cell wall biosynthesis
LSFNDTPCAGEVKKNQLLLNRLLEFDDLKIREIDTINCKGKLGFGKALLSILIKSHWGRRKIILSTYDNAVFAYLRYFRLLGLKNNIIYWVIGGGVGKKIAEGLFPVELYKSLDCIIVEDKDIQNQMKECGLTRVITVPNFKPIPFVQKKKFEMNTKRFIFLSRITPLKGCDIIISAAKKLRRKGFDFVIDFYGPIENDYPFEEYIENEPCLSYKGFLSLEAPEDFEYISQYDAILFPTYYPNEGFPGVLIDGFIAGLPIITTNWRYNSHIIDHGKTGWLLPIQDSESLANLIEEIILGKYNLNVMSENCQERSKEFDTKKVLTKELLMELGIL